MWLKVLLLAITLINYCNAFPAGAGTTACESMIPSHQQNVAQTSEIPVTITVSTSNVPQGQYMTLAIESVIPGFEFSGFIIQARALSTELQVVGQFSVTEGMRILNCVTLPANSVATHTSSNLKSRIEFHWQAPVDYLGIINFRVSVVQSFDTFWVGGQSGFVLISPGGEQPIAPPIPPTFEPPVIDADEIYDDCVTNKVCFGYPIGCIGTRDCHIFGAVIHEDDSFIFELLSEPGVAYVAMALSDDDRMGRDSVIECVNQNGLNAFTSFTSITPHSSTRLQNQDIIRLKLASVIDGRIYCRVERDSLTTIEGMTFDLINDKHFLLLASGPEIGLNSIGPHSRREASPEDVLLTIPRDIEPPVIDIGNIYDGCAITKVCFGSPGGCLSSRDCAIFGAVIYADDIFIFELLSEPDIAYVAIALSDDDRMGQDSVIECVNRNGVHAFTSFTSITPHSSPRLANQNSIHMTLGQVIDGRIYCLVERDSYSVINGVTFDLVRDKHFLLLAHGPIATDNFIGPHTRRDASDVAVLLTDPRKIQPGRRVMVLIHGSLMVVSWIGLTTIGIFFARYFKKTWTNKTICGKEAWFFWHMFCMTLTWILTISAFVIIFVDIGQWRTTVHSVMGTVAMVFVFLQPIGGIFRPTPTAEYRPVFNFIHFSFGNITHMLGIITIFFAVPLALAELPHWMNYVLIAFVVFYLLMHIIFTVIGVFGDIKRRKKLGSSKDAPYRLLRKTLLGFFILMVLLFVIALILIITLPRF